MEGKPSANHLYKGGRSPDQYEADLVDIARMYLQGYQQVEIIRWIGENREYTIGSTQLSRDIKELHRRWMVAHVMDYDVAKGKELERVDMLERAYWEGYERSMRERREEFEENVRDVQSGGDGENLDVRGGGRKVEEGDAVHVYQRTKKKTKRMERDGSVSFLQGVERCIGLRCQILGLNAPQQLSISWRKDAKSAGINPDEFKREMIRQYVGKAKQNLTEAARLQMEVEETGDVIEGELRDAETEEDQASR